MTATPNQTHHDESEALAAHMVDDITGSPLCGYSGGDAYVVPRWARVTCPECRAHATSDGEIRLPTSTEQAQAAIDSAERVGEAVVRIADAFRLVLPVIVGAVSDIRRELTK